MPPEADLEEALEPGSNLISGLIWFLGSRFVVSSHGSVLTRASCWKEGGGQMRVGESTSSAPFAISVFFFSKLILEIRFDSAKDKPFQWTSGKSRKTAKNDHIHYAIQPYGILNWVRNLILTRIIIFIIVCEIKTNISSIFKKKN